MSYSIDEKAAELEAQGLVRACPICGRKVWHTCYHDGNDVSSVEMPLEKQRDLWITRSGGIQIRECDDWIAVYLEGMKVFEGHSCSLVRGLEALDIEFDYEYRDEADPDEWFPKDLI